LYFWVLTVWLGLLLYVVPKQMLYMWGQSQRFLNGESDGSARRDKKNK